MAYPIYSNQTPEEIDIARKRKIAEILRQQSMQNDMQGQMISGHYVGPSWTQGLAKLLQAKNSKDWESQADTQETGFHQAGQQSMETLAKMLADPATTDEARNAALMSHTQKYGRGGIDTYLAAQNAATQSRNAATAADNAKRKREAIEMEAKQGEDFMRVLMPGAQFSVEAGMDDFQIIPASFDPQSMQVNAQAGRDFGIDEEAMGRIVAMASKDPKLASRLALEEYKRLSRGKSEAKDVIAKERAMAEAMGMPVGEYLKQKMNKSGVNVTVQNYGEPKAVQMPDGSQGLVRFSKDPNAPPVIVPFTPPASDTEQMTAGYADRMSNAENILRSVGQEGNPSWTTAVVGGVAGDAAKQMVMSKEQQQHRQAQEDWVRAKLRKESGAVIAEEEMDREIKTYFPMPWDKPETIKQKERARQVAIDAMKKTAGPAMQRKPAPQQPAASKLSPAEQKELEELRKRFGK